MKAKEFLEGFVDILFPPDVLCPFCDKETDSCSCIENIDIFNIRECPICGRRGIGRAPHSACPNCIRLQKIGALFFDQNFCYARYSGTIKKAIRDMKYHGVLHYRRIFGTMLYEKYLDAGLKKLEIDVVTYIPIAYSRRLSRGFNQSEEIARVFCRLSELPLLPLLKKCKRTKKLSLRTMMERSAEIKGSMSVLTKHSAMISDKKILLIDDIFTTGATINEASKLLKNAGASKVYSMTLGG